MTINTHYLKQQNDCRLIAAKYTELRKVNQHESHGPCPFCGGRDRFVAKQDGWFCRPGQNHCAQTGDTIKLIMLKERVNFLEACAMLGSDYMADCRPVQPIAQTEHRQTDMGRYAWRMADGHDLFMNSNALLAQQCRGYWTGRGFTMETAERYRIAYQPEVWLPNSSQGHPAIAIPWLDRDGELQAIKYRYLQTHTYIDNDGEEAECKNTSRGSMRGNVFGWQGFSGSRDIFILTEGELNACAIWQAFVDQADVLSAGAQGMIVKPPADIIRQASTYKYRLVWADEVAIAQQAATMINGLPIASSRYGGDAADMLRAGLLTNFFNKLSAKLFTISNINA